TKAEDMTLEGLARKLEIDVDGFVATIRAYNASLKTGDYNPAIKDGKATHGITPPKPNWALPPDAPPYVGFAVTRGLTSTVGGRRLARPHRGVDRVEEPLREQHAVTGEEAFELGVEDVRDAVVLRVATRAAVRLHQRLRRLERVPAGIAGLPGGRPRIAQVR